MNERSVVFVTYDGIQVLDVTGPSEVFAIANRFIEPPGSVYDVVLAAHTVGPVRTSGGIGLLADRRLAEMDAVHTLMVPGGFGVEMALADTELLDHVSRLAGAADRVASVCTGAFLLAAVGALDGKRATTHWHDCELLAALCPAVTIDPDAIFVRDGNVSTSAGITAGIDLALALVEEDHGHELASRVARQLVVFLQRPGGQSQFSSHLNTRLADRGSIRELQAWIADHLAEDLSIAALAGRAGMSSRNLARVFHAQTGTTPAHFVEMVRIEAAKRWLQSTRAGIGEIAGTCGFGTPETLHRAFRKRVGVTPGNYRARFTNTSP